MLDIRPHYKKVGLRNEFLDVWRLLKDAGEVRLKTEKKKTIFIARAATIKYERGNGKEVKTIAFLRQIARHGKLKQVSACLECCWGYYYSCTSQPVGAYCKALDKWATFREKGSS